MYPFIAFAVMIALVVAVEFATSKTLSFKAPGLKRGGVTPSSLTGRAGQKAQTDKALYAEIALPAAAGQAETGVIDIQDDIYRFTDTYKVRAAIPALTAAQVPDTTTVTATIKASALPDKSNPITLGTTTVTGAGAAGAAAKNLDIRLQSNTPRYLFADFVSGAGTGSMATLKGKLELVF